MSGGVFEFVTVRDADTHTEPTTAATLDEAVADFEDMAGDYPSDVCRRLGRDEWVRPEPHHLAQFLVITHDDEGDEYRTVWAIVARDSDTTRDVASAKRDDDGRES